MKKTKTNTFYALRSKLHVRAFTLIEILIFTAIVSVFFVVAAAVSAFSLSVMRTNENRIYATHYADEAAEWILNEKDTTDWLTFSGHEGTFCMVTLAWTGTGACPTSGGGSYALGSEYGREFNRDVVLSTLGDGSISSSVTVSWKDANGNVLNVPIKTIYAQTE